MFLTSKLITCFIDGFTFKMKSQKIAYNLLTRSAHIHCILDLEGEVHSIVGLKFIIYDRQYKSNCHLDSMFFSAIP